MQLTLHHLPNSRSQRIVWLLEELNLNYDLVITSAIQSNKATHKYPLLELQLEQHRLSLTETSAIAEYLCQLHQKLIIPIEHPYYWNYCFYRHWADASFMANVALKQVFQQIKLNTPFVIKFVSWAMQVGFNKSYLNPELKQQLHQLNTHLEQHIWIVGNQFSYADILIWFPLQACQYAHPDFEQYQALKRYLQQLQHRPAFMQASLRGEWSNEVFEHYWQVTQ